MKKLLSGLFLVFLLVFSGCQQAGLKKEKKIPDLNQEEIILATTTSVYDSGLLDELISRFEKKSGYRVKILAVGSGEALKMGERGDADLLLVHSPQEEEYFMKQGFGKERKPLMVNYFVFLGPSNDPAKVEGLPVFQAFREIARKKSLFVSRADNSGTHQRELKLWREAGVKPEKSWYLESGQGMGESLKIASEKQAYILSDKGSYLALKNSLELKILSNKEEDLINRYNLITVNPAKFAGVNYEGARKLMSFLLSREIKVYIARYGRKKFGEPLFLPMDSGVN